MLLHDLLVGEGLSPELRDYVDPVLGIPVEASLWEEQTSLHLRLSGIQQQFHL